MRDGDVNLIHAVSDDVLPGRIDMLRALLERPELGRQRVVHLGGGEIDAAGLGRVTRVTAPLDIGWLARGALKELLAAPGRAVLHLWSAKALRWAAPAAMARRQEGARGPAVLLDAEATLNVGRLAASFADEWTAGEMGFVCPTEAALRRVLGSGAPANRCVVIRDSVDLGAGGARRGEDVRARLRIGAGDTVIMLLPPVLRSMGSLTAIWAAMLLAQIRRDTRFIVPGEGREIERVRRLVESCGEGARLRCAGRAFHVRELLSASDIAVYLPPGDAPLGAVAEALASGCPLVASAVPAATELLVHGRNSWLCKPGVPRDAARRLLQALEEAEQTRRQTDAGRSQAYELFSRRRMVEQYRRVYQNALAGTSLGDGVERRPAIA